MNFAVGNNVEGLKRVLRRGVSPNSRYNSSATLLGNALENGSYDAAALLLSNGANPDWRTLRTSANDRTGKTFDTPLHTAVRRCRLDLVKLLIGAGANACIRNAENKLPYHLSVSCQPRTEISQVFRSVSATSCEGVATTGSIADEIEQVDQENETVAANLRPLFLVEAQRRAVALAQADLPKQIDGETTLVSMESRGAGLIYSQQMRSLKKELPTHWIQARRAGLIPQVCLITHPHTRP